jgi:hypothetical protein
MRSKEFKIQLFCSKVVVRANMLAAVIKMLTRSHRVNLPSSLYLVYTLSYSYN